MYQKHGISGLFLLLVVILIVKPRVFYNLYNHILGRVLLIGVVLFFTMCNVTLGLLAALCLIIASNMFLIEGLDNLDSSNEITIGDDNIVNSSPAKIKVTSKAKDKDGAKISELQAQADTEAQAQADTEADTEAFGVDRLTLQETMQSKSSKSIPVNATNFMSENVRPSEPTTSIVSESFINKYASF